MTNLGLETLHIVLVQDAENPEAQNDSDLVTSTKIFV